MVKLHVTNMFRNMYQLGKITEDRIFINFLPVLKLAFAKAFAE